MKMLRLLLAFCALLLAGCGTLSREAPRPGQTTLGSRLVILSAQVLDNYLVVETKSEQKGVLHHFLVDTGSNVVLVTPEFARRHTDKGAFTSPAADLRVKSANGGIAVLPAVWLDRIVLGDARFDHIQARIYDCAELSAHLGVKIDGILGFPLFRDTLLTLDYPHSRVLLQWRKATPPATGVTIAFNNATKTPLIPVRLGDRTFIALIDSGRDSPLSLNPIGLAPEFADPPRIGSIVSSLTGDRVQRVGRLAETFALGDYLLPRQHAELIDELSAIGGEVLKNFIVTFDQEHGKVTFQRDTPTVPPPPARRSTGLSFSKTPAYWRIASVIPDSPAEFVEIEDGDLVTQINGEPVAKWDLGRYEQLVASADEIAFTFLMGTKDAVKKVKVFTLVR